jgi:hypothetical protein
MTRSEVAQLKKIISIAQSLLGEKETKKGQARKRQGRIRRSGKELLSFRRMLTAERKAGVPVAEIARKHGVSASYIYQLD